MPALSMRLIKLASKFYSFMIIEMINLKKQRKKYIYFIFYLFILAVMYGCAGFHNPKTVEEIPQEDVVLAMKIKAKLIEAKEFNAAAINVEASNGLIKLSGFVETESQRKLAYSITKKIPNVKQVDNQIKVK